MIRELRLEVNKACNYSCVHCYTDKRAHGKMSMEQIEDLLDDVCRNGATDLSLTGGEPLLAWRRVASIAQLARARNMRVRINTNGHLLRPEIAEALVPLIDEFQVSLNGGDAAFFDRFVQKPGAFAKVTEGIARLVAAGSIVSIRFTLMEETAPELVPTFKLVEELGVHNFKVRMLVPSGPIKPDREAARDLLRQASLDFFQTIRGSAVKVRFADGGLGLAVPSTENCKPLYCLCGADALFVDADGAVMPCPFLREDTRFKLGNVLVKPLSRISSESALLAEFIGEKAEDCGNEQANGCRAADLSASAAEAILPAGRPSAPALAAVAVPG